MVKPNKISNIAVRITRRNNIYLAVNKLNTRTLQTNAVGQISQICNILDNVKPTSSAGLSKI
jgi:hypothetical protein